MFNAKIIADSKMEFGHRCTSYLLTFPRYILAEFNTHRMFGRNSASSRAIPFDKMITSVQETPFIPMKWMIDHKGMQGTVYVDDPTAIEIRNEQWLNARNAAVVCAKMLHGSLDELGINDTSDPTYAPITKQVCNRLLEPFMWHTVACTATEYQNFFALRAHDAADIHMQEIARMMLEGYNQIKPANLAGGKWHLPFITDEDGLDQNHLVKTAIAVSVARAARTSYTVVGAEAKLNSIESDRKLHDGLLAQGHMSPFEHPATAMTEGEYFGWTKTILVDKKDLEKYVADNNAFTYRVKQKFNDSYLVEEFGWCGHLRGFIPYRKMIPDENRRDSRVN